MKKESVQRPRKIVKQDITEEQFMAILRQVCQPLEKPAQSAPKRPRVEEKIMGRDGGNGLV